MKNNKYKKKVVLITGATSGIGAEIATQYCQKGAHVIGFGRRGERLKDISKSIKKSDSEGIFIGVKGDVTLPEDLEKAVKKAIDEFGQLDTVIANAGFGVTGSFENLTIEDYRRQFETNIFGVLHTAKASIDALKKTKGTFAIVGSVNSYICTPRATPYAMSKFAVKAFADGLRYEWANFGVAVTLLCPGIVESEIFKISNEGVYDAKIKDKRPSWLIVDTPDATREMIRAIDRRKQEKIITGHGKVLVYAQRHFPWSLRGILGGKKIQEQIPSKRQ